jgi:hypothetical protein
VAAAGRLIDVWLEDVDGQRVSLGELRGLPALVVYAGRLGAAAALRIGVELEARLGGGAADPRARVVPVACLGEVPRFLRGFARSQVRQAAAGVAVWIDFERALEQTFGMHEALANVAVLDAAGRVAGVTAGEGTACIDAVTALMNRLHADRPLSPEHHSG